MGGHETRQSGSQRDVITVQWTPSESHCGIKYTLYNLGMPTSGDEPRVRIIPIEDDERDIPGESLPRDQTVKPVTGPPVAKRPWWFIGGRFIEGIPFTTTKPH